MTWRRWGAATGRGVGSPRDHLDNRFRVALVAGDDDVAAQAELDNDRAIESSGWSVVIPVAKWRVTAPTGRGLVAARAADGATRRATMAVNALGTSAANTTLD